MTLGVGSTRCAALVANCKGSIKDCSVKSCTVNGGRYSGALAGSGYSAITDNAVEDTVITSQYKGGGCVGYFEDGGSVSYNTLKNVTVQKHATPMSDKYYLGRVVGQFNIPAKSPGTQYCKNNVVTNPQGDAEKNIGNALIQTTGAELSEVDDVAKIGNTGYATLTAAVTAAKAGTTAAEKTITIVGEVGSYAFDGDCSGITFLGTAAGKVTGGWTVQGANTNMSNITIKDLTFCDGGNVVFSTATSNFSGLTIERCTFTGTGATGTPAISIGTGTAPYDGLTIKGNTISGYSGTSSSAIIVNNDNGNANTGTITIEGNTVSNFGHNGVQFILAKADLVIKDNSFTRSNSKDVLNLNSAKSVTLTGNTFTVPADYSTGNQIVWNSNAGTVVDATDNTFVKGTQTIADIAAIAPHLSGSGSSHTFVGYGLQKDTGGKLTGGYLLTYAETTVPSDLLADGYEATSYTQYGNVYAYQVTEKKADPVASVTIGSETTNYTDLHAALEAGKVSGAVVTLLSDVDLTGVAWTPVGDATKTGDTYTNAFKGTLDGAGYKITGLTVSGASQVGLIGFMNGGTVKNLTVTGADIDGTGSQVGVIAGGAFFGTIENVDVLNSTIGGTGKYVGSIVGGSVLTVKGCEATGNTVTGKDQVGGVIGYLASGSVLNCTVNNNVTATEERAGGIVGKANTDSEFFINGNTVSGTVSAPDFVGGVAAQIMGVSANYAIRNNDINVTKAECTGEMNPIGNLRRCYEDDGVTFADTNFVKSLAANITGNWWENATLNADSFNYEPSGVDVQTIYRGVAKIGDKPYKSIKAAIEAATAGQTITMIVDVDLATASEAKDSAIYIDKSITLDLNGKTITVSAAQTADDTGEATAIVVTNDSAAIDVTIKNGTITTTNAANGIIARKNATLTLTGLTVDQNGLSAAKAYRHAAVTATEGAVVNIESGTYSAAYYALYNKANGGKITVTNGTFTTDGQAAALDYENGAAAAVRADFATATGNSVTINGGTFTVASGKNGMSADFGGASDSKAVITGGTFTNVVESRYNKVEISGGTFNATIYPTDGGHCGYYLLSGGTFIEDPTPSATVHVNTEIKAGYEVVANDTNPKTWTVQEAPRTISVTSTQELQDALDSAKKGDTIVVAAGDYGTVYLRNNGTYSNRIMKDVTVKAADGAQVNIAQFTTQYPNNAFLDIENFTIDGLTFSDATKTGVLLDYNQSNGYGMLRVNGFTVKNCTKVGDGSKEGTGYDHRHFVSFCFDGNDLYTQYAGDTSLECGYHAITIEDNTITNVNYPIFFQNNGPKSNLTVKGNTFTGCKNNHVGVNGSYISGENVIAGNTIIGQLGRFVRISGATDESTFTITGNTVKNPAIFEDEYGIDTVKITGTTGFDVTESDNTWNSGSFTSEEKTTWISNGTPVAQIVSGDKTKYFGTLEAAVEASQTGETITLIADIAYAKDEKINLTGTKTFTLDLNGKVISGQSETSSFYFFNINTGVNITVKDSSEAKSGKITFKCLNPDPSYNKESCTVYNCGGTLTLESGTIENTTTTGLTYAVNNSSNAWANPIVSTFNMTGGVITAPNGDAALRIYQNAGAQVSENYVSISGGTILDKGIFVDTYTYQPAGTTTDNSKTKTVISITGGTINGLVDYKLRNDKISTTIAGGEFANCSFRVRNYTSESIITGFSKPIIAINGGKFAFVSDAEVFTTTGFTTGVNPYSINAGLFSAEPPAAAIASGYCVAANTEEATKTAYPYTVQEAKKIAEVETAAGTTQYSDLHAALEAGKVSGAVVTLLSDVDLTGVEWTPVADFAGTLDGKGYTITGLTVSAACNAGMFASMASSTVKNVVIDKASITATGYSSDTYSYAAVICASAGTSTVFENITVKNSTVTAPGEYVGTIVGAGYPETIEGCSVQSCTITGLDQVGGLIGYTKSGNIEGNAIDAQTTITATDTRAGGIVGKIQTATGENCFVGIVDNNVSAKLETGTDGVSGGIYGQIMGDWDKYSITGNTIAATGATNPIGTLRDGQNAAFTGALAANITGNWWEDATSTADSFQYTNVAKGVEAQTIYRGVATVTSGSTTKAYKTLDEAFVAAINGGTITLLVDYTGVLAGKQTANYYANGDVVFDLNGHTWTVLDGTVYYTNGIRLYSGNLTVKNGTIAAPDGIDVFQVEGGTLTIESGDYYNDGKGTTIAGSDSNGCDGNFVVKGGTLGKVRLGTSCKSAMISGGTFKDYIVGGSNFTGTVDISGGTFTSINGGAGTVNVSAGTFSGQVYCQEKSGVVNISGGTFGSYVGNGGPVNISGGNFVAANLRTTQSTFSISGGTFASSGYYASIASSRTAGLDATKYVVKDADGSYAYSKVALASDSDAPYYVRNTGDGKCNLCWLLDESTVTRCDYSASDLQAWGYQITDATDLSVIKDVYAIADVPNLIAPLSAEGYGPVSNGDGTYTVKQVAAKIGDVYYETLSAAIAVAKSGDTITLLASIADQGNVSLPAGVTLDGNGKTISGNTAVYINAAGGTVENVKFSGITNGKDLSAIYANGLTGTATITGCTFTDCDWDAIQITPVAGAVIDIQNNTFAEVDTTIVGQRFVHIQSDQNVDFSATVTGNIMKGSLQQGALECYYFADADDVTLSKNYIQDTTNNCILQGNGTNVCEMAYPMYTDEAMTTLTSPVAAIKSTYNAKFYTSLSAATAAAKSGETITLLANLADQGNVSLPAGVTLDGNGKTLSGNSCVYINAAGGTVENVIFSNITNGNNLSAIYANGLTGTATITGCEFTDCDWDAIQITPVAGAVISITGNKFAETGGSITGQRFVHIQSASNVDFSATVTGNVMKGSTAQGALECYYFADASNVELDKNYIQDTTNNCILQGSGANVCEMAYPMYTDEEMTTLTSPVAAIKSTYTAKFYGSLADAVAAAEANDTITIVSDITLNKEVTVPAGKSFTLDLNGKTIQNASEDFEFTRTSKALRDGVPQRFMMVVEGNMVITDSSANHDGKISASNYNYGTTKAVLVNGNGKVTLNGGEIYGEYASFYVVGNTVINPEEVYHPELTLNGGKVSGGYGVCSKGATALVTVNDGATISASNGEALNTNGTTDWYDGGNNKIIVNGGTITSTGGAAMYNPAENTVEINGGTFTGTTALAIKGGNVQIAGGTFIATGAKAAPGSETSGYTSTGDALYVEDTYENHTPVVTVVGGKFKSAYGNAVQYYTTKDAQAENKGYASISGGIFDDDSAKSCLAEGKVVVANPDSATSEEYPYAIGSKTQGIVIKDKSTGSEVKVDVGTTVDYSVLTDESAKIPAEVLTEVKNKTIVSGLELQANATEALGNVNGVQAVVNAAKAQAVSDANVAFTNAVMASSTINTTVTLTVDVQVTAIKYDSTAGTIKYDLNPVATVTIKNGDAAAVSQQVEVTNDMIDSSKPITVKLYTGTPAPSYLVHRADDGSLIDVYYPAASATEGQKTFAFDSATGVCTLEVTHFSTMESTNTPPVAVAWIGTTEYETLQAAVDAVKDGGTITIKADNTETLTVSEAKSFDITGGTFDEPTGTGFTVEVSGTKVTVTQNTFEVTLTSRIKGTGTTVAPVGGGGNIGAADGTTLYASSRAGYKFLGWYTGYDYDEKTSTFTSIGTLVSDQAVCTYKPTAKVTLYAVYEADDTAMAEITVNASEFTVNGEPQDTEYQGSLEATSLLDLAYTGSDKFLYWRNASGAIVSTSSFLRIRVVGDTEYTAVTANTVSTGRALVVFKNLEEGGQQLKANYYSSASNISYPNNPSSYGKTFENWAVTYGGVEYEATPDKIHELIAGGATYLVVYGSYEAKDTYDVKVNIVTPKGTYFQETITVESGDTCWYEITDTGSYNFGYWELNGDKVCTSEYYKFIPTKDSTLNAHLGGSSEVIQRVTIDSVTGSTDNGRYKLAIRCSYALDGMAVSKAGVLFYVNPNTDFTYENKDYVKYYEWDKSTGDYNSDVMVLNVSTDDPDKTIYYRAYVVLSNGNVVYSPLEEYEQGKWRTYSGSASYNTATKY